LEKYPFYRDLNIDLNHYKRDSKYGFKYKVTKDLYSSVDPNNIEPYPGRCMLGSLKNIKSSHFE
jgi:hypothetical protein